MLMRFSLCPRLIAVLENSDSFVLKDDFILVRISANRIESAHDRSSEVLEPRYLSISFDFLVYRSGAVIGLCVPDVDLQLITLHENPIALAVAAREPLYNDLLVTPFGHFQRHGVVLGAAYVSGAPTTGRIQYLEIPGVTVVWLHGAEAASRNDDLLVLLSPNLTDVC